ncbi:MAG: hypothetical protein ACYCT1_13595 [Steroidobacteraceae bacterium]
MKTSTIVLSGLMLLTSFVAVASTPRASVPARTAAPGPLADGAHAVMPAVGVAPNTAYEQAVTAYLNNVLIEAQKHRAQASSPSRERNAVRSEGPARGSTRLPAAVNVADLPQVEAIMIGARAKARLMSSSGGLLVVGLHDVTRYGTVTRIDSTGVWLRPEGLSNSILLEDLTPSELAPADGARSAGSMGPYGNSASIATPPIPISPSPSRLPSGVRGN